MAGFKKLLSEDLVRAGLDNWGKNLGSRHGFRNKGAKFGLNLYLAHHGQHLRQVQLEY